MVRGAAATTGPEAARALRVLLALAGLVALLALAAMPGCFYSLDGSLVGQRRDGRVEASVGGDGGVDARRDGIVVVDAPGTVDGKPAQQ